MSLRIISGERRGALLTTPEGETTRPLRDRIREALFSMLRADLRDATVLDAFAGSGAVGLEAVSNGAAHATLVEMSPAACRCIRSNITKLRYEDRATLLEGASPGVLARHRPPAPWQLLFLMPPYHSGLCDVVLRAPAVLANCAPDAMAICEIHAEEPAPVVEGWTLEKDRPYGITRLWIARRV